MAEPASAPPGNVAIDVRRVFATHATGPRAVVALQGLSLAIERGEFVAVLGPSGAGKSTLMSCLAGRHRPLAGELRALGTRLHDATSREIARWRAEHVGVVGQRFMRALSDDLRVLDLVTLPARLRGAPVATARKRGLELLALSGLEGRADAYRQDLSGGEQQRVAVCAALSSAPSLLLADEVTGELDEEAGRTVLALLRKLVRDDGVTVVLATHDPKATAFADRAVTVRDGRVTAELTPLGRTVMIDESGLLRFDARDLAEAGIADRARLELGERCLTLRAVPPPSAGNDAAATASRCDGGDAALATSAPHGPSTASPRAPSPNAATIVLDAVTKVYGSGTTAVRALDDVSLHVPGPGLYVLVAPSGSGKSTLLHITAGLERPTSGEVRVAGVPLDDKSRHELAAFRREHLALVPQASALSAHMTVEENVALALLVRNGSEQDSSAVDEALAAVSLASLGKRRAGELSGGERQRVAIARALVARSSVILADEPTSNLDETNAAAVGRLLARLAADWGLAILCATHDPAVIANADRVLQLAELRQAPARPGGPG